jgi:hypothetical protein
VLPLFLVIIIITTASWQCKTHVPGLAALFALKPSFARLVRQARVVKMVMLRSQFVLYKL